jgi:NAD(P)-dependent dehydrogenase (short-subunit alcohol dehydrogenase family)
MPAWFITGCSTGLGRSLAEAVLDRGYNAVVTARDPAAVAGKRRKENQSRHGTQPGDPAKAAQAIITAVQAPDAPALLVLGQDAVGGLRRVRDAQRAELEAWEPTSLSTGFSA